MEDRFGFLVEDDEGNIEVNENEDTYNYDNYGVEENDSE